MILSHLVNDVHIIGKIKDFSHDSQLEWEDQKKRKKKNASERLHPINHVAHKERSEDMKAIL